MPNDDLQAQVQSELKGQYSITRELPRGGMSRVFVATEDALRRVVVIKVLSPELAATLSSDRFKREIGIAARLQHPHVVPLLAAGSAGKNLYYTMPLMDGESLRERMSRERPMSIDDICRIMSEVACALAYAHDEGVVHRDIKPENVMFFHGKAVVLDFGIGKALINASTAETELKRITQTGMSLGTPTYVAPEQAAGDPALDYRADIYALGVVAYEMLTGHPPFSGKSPHAVIQAHASDLPTPVWQRRADTPKALGELVMKCLEKKPASRPAHAQEIVNALDSGGNSYTPRSGSMLVTLSARAAWLPWTIAALSTVAAIVFATLYMLRSR